MRRRALLTTVAGTASTAALAGCSGILGDSDGSGSEVPDGARAPYVRYLPAGLHEIVDDVDVPAQQGVTIDLTSPNSAWVDRPGAFPDDDWLVELGTSSVTGVLLAADLMTERVGLGDVFDADGGVERVHYSLVPILEGSFDPDRIASDLEAAGLAPAGTYEGFQFHEVADGPEVVAFDGEHVFVGVMEASSDEDPEPSTDRPIRAIVEASVDALGGTRPTANEEIEAFADLTTALPERQCMTCTYHANGRLFEDGGDGDQRDEGNEREDGSTASVTDLEGDARGVASAFDLSVEPGTETTFFVAIRYADADEVDDESAIQAAIAANATEPDVAVDGPLAVVSGTYERRTDS